MLFLFKRIMCAKFLPAVGEKIQQRASDFCVGSSVFPNDTVA